MVDLVQEGRGLPYAPSVHRHHNNYRSDPAHATRATNLAEANAVGCSDWPVSGGVHIE